jgi:nitrite reductase/ring-hydroxylating ferredoxin subunit
LTARLDLVEEAGYDTAMQHVVDSPLADRNQDQRRSFLVRLAAVVVGGIVAIFPFAAGLGVLFHPLCRRRAARGNAVDDGDDRFVRVAALDALPDDGTPRQFSLTADVADAWTCAPGQRIGSVFLSAKVLDGKPVVTALSSICPHLGCAVDFDAAADRFECPCHESGFAEDGAKLFGPSQRGLDPLDVKLVDANGGQEVWVAPQRFRAGVAERVPIR